MGKRGEGQEQQDGGPAGGRWPRMIYYSTAVEYMSTAHKRPRNTPFPFLDRDSNFSLLPKLSKMDKTISNVMESCTFGTALSGVGGYGLGAIMGLFMYGVESPAHHDATVRATLLEMRARMHSSGKTFAAIGALFRCSECALESVRGKTDNKGVFSAGFISGGVLGLRVGLKAAIYGGLGFGVFSVAIEYYLLQRH